MSDATQPSAAEPAATTLQEYTHTLKHPIEVRTPKGDHVVDTVTAITMKRPKAKHMRAMDKASGEMGKALLLIQSTSGLPMTVIDELDGEDVTALADVIADFFGVSLPTG